MRARVAYDGTCYKGWQYQVNMETVQGTLERCLERKFGQLIRVVGASRTDTGVHARGQAVHFDIPLEKALHGEERISKLQFTMNQMLPDDVTVTNLSLAPCHHAEESASDETLGMAQRQPPHWRQWHAIYNSRGKLYSYRICTDQVCDPLDRLYRHFEWRANRLGFSEDLLRQATQKFEGSHDFSAFTNTACTPPGIVPPLHTNPVRTIRRANVVKERDGMYKIEFYLDGALYRMVRNVVGTILHVACGKMELSHIDTLFAYKDRRLVPKSAPAKGLCLEKVFYDDLDF